MSSNYWHSTSFGKIAILHRESVSAAEIEDGSPYVGLEHIGQGTLRLQGVGRGEDAASGKSRFVAGDVLFGKLRPYFRKVVRPAFDGVCSTDIWVIRARERVDPGFLFYLVASQDFVDYANSGSSGTRMPRANWKHVEGFRVLLPPLEEQRAIAEVFQALDERIEILRSVSRTAEALLIEAYRGLPLQKFTAVEVGRLVEICGGATPSTQDLSLWNGPHNWFTPRDLSNQISLVVGASQRTVSDAGLSKISSSLLPVGTVIMSSRAPIGYVAVLSNPAAINQGFIALPPSKSVSSAFLVAWIRTSLAMIVGRAGGSTFPEISKRNFRSLLIPQPEGPEYEAFVLLGDFVISIIENASKEMERLREVRDALLPKLVSGEIRIKDPHRLLDQVV